MKIKVGKHTSERKANRLKKKIRIRKTVKGTQERPRLCVFRSGKHIYAQVINDVDSKTVLAATSIGMTDASGKDQAKAVGEKIAQLATKAGIKDVVFDRNGYLYHGRVKSLADGARAAGLNF